MAMIRVFACLALMLAVAWPLGAQDFAERVEAAVAWEIEAGCARGDGRLEEAGRIELDLTGDGRADLVVDHRHLRCDGGAESGYCSNGLCAFRVYVRRGDRLQTSAIQRGSDLWIEDGAIHWVDRRGETRSMRWTGRRFE
jgi:hypothetical protein